MPTAKPLPVKTTRSIVQRYTRRKDPQSIRVIAGELDLTYWRTRAVLLAEGVEVRSQGGTRGKKPTG